eukprot:Sdes_comp18708_c0_seq2m9024
MKENAMHFELIEDEDEKLVFALKQTLSLPTEAGVSQASKTPLDKIFSRLQSFPSEESYSVLVSTGSYNPIHAFHLELLDQAKVHLETRHHSIVLGAFLSPSHDQWVRSKLPSDSVLHSHDRIETCQLAVQDSPYVCVSTWEAEQTNFVSFPHVIAHVWCVLKAFLQPCLNKDARLDVYYVCGLDHALRCRLFEQTLYSVICVDRNLPTLPDDLPPFVKSCRPNSRAAPHHSHCGNWFHFISGPFFHDSGISSSLIRAGHIHGSLSPVFHYLTTHCSYLSWHSLLLDPFFQHPTPCHSHLS